MESNFTRKIKDSFRKNMPEVIALSTISLPGFVYRRSSELSEKTIPVFNSHVADIHLIEEQFDFISKNKYQTLSADQYLDFITGKKTFSNAILLTFDDGRKDFWTIAYPLLRKYGLKAVSFIIPSVIKTADKSPSLEDVWSGRISPSQLEKISLGDEFCNWKEIDEMHKSGLVDFQSHSMYHASVYGDDKLINFVNPDFRDSILNSTFNPLETKNLRGKQYGSPVFRWTSALTAEERFLNDETVEKICIEFVNTNGGESFFNQKQWKSTLTNVYKSTVDKVRIKGAYQNKELRYSEVLNDLSLSKKIIEERLNKTVNHLCYPWFKGSARSVELSGKAGYKTNFWGILNNKSINKPGDDPMYIKRINDYYIFSLPGKSRRSLGKQIITKVRAS